LKKLKNQSNAEKEQVHTQCFLKLQYQMAAMHAYNIYNCRKVVHSINIKCRAHRNHRYDDKMHI
jgi:hypothetical protein